MVSEKKTPIHSSPARGKSSGYSMRCFSQRSFTDANFEHETWDMKLDRRRHSSPSSSPYRYRRLAQAEERQVHVRIVRLDFDAFEDEIVIRTKEWVISEGDGRRDGDDKKRKPCKNRDRDSDNDDDKWFALLHIWKNDQARERMTMPAHNLAVNAALGANYILVTSNLMRALRHVRSEHAARRL